MNKNIKDIIKCIVILIGVVCYAYIFSYFFNNGAGVLPVINSAISLVTLLIALVLVNRFGIEQDIIKKNFETISELFLLLAKIRILATDTNGSIFQIYLLRDLRRKERYFIDLINEWGDKVVAADVSVLNGVDKILVLGENIYMPKDISLSIRKLEKYHVYMSRNNMGNDSSKYVFLEMPDEDRKVFSAGENKYIESKEKGLLGGGEIKLSEYLRLFNDVYDACRKWLKNNSSIDLDIDY